MAGVRAALETMLHTLVDAGKLRLRIDDLVYAYKDICKTPQSRHYQ
jgi:hypothetical protein